jgi:hypothetical protein
MLMAEIIDIMYYQHEHHANFAVGWIPCQALRRLRRKGAAPRNAAPLARNHAPAQEHFNRRRHADEAYLRLS